MILVCLLNEYYVGPRFIPTVLMYGFDIRASGATGKKEGTLQVLPHEKGFVGPAPLGTSTPPPIEISVCFMEMAPNVLSVDPQAVSEVLNLS